MGHGDMLRSEKRITLFVGNFGSGKTEVAVNYALFLAETDPDARVSLADLDLVSPYFRSREPLELMESRGIHAILPEPGYRHADLPILVPEVRSVLMNSDGRVVLDVGGDDVGARVLGALEDALRPDTLRALMVVNANRPFTRTVEGVKQMIHSIQQAAHLAITGLVSNTHMMEDTTLEDVLAGYGLSGEVGARLGLPLEFVCVPQHLLSEARAWLTCEILPISRCLSFPWRAPEGGTSGPGMFRLS